MSKCTLSQYYTPREIWEDNIPKLKNELALKFDLSKMRIVDPCAGDGSMISKYFPNGISFDIDPRHPRVKQANMNYLDYSQFGESVAVVSNIPFNANSYPIKKMNQMAKFDNVKVIAVINASKYEYYPYDSYSCERFHSYFHLKHSWPVDNRLFPGNVGMEITFQVWVRMPTKRPKYEMLIIFGLKGLIGEGEFRIRHMSKKFHKKGEGESPVQFAYEEKDCNTSNTSVIFHKSLSHLSDNEKYNLLLSIVKHTYKFFWHQQQKLGPGHLIKSAIELGYYVGSGKHGHLIKKDDSTMDE